MNARAPLVAVDVGNTRIKLGLFADGDDAALPQPHDVLRLPAQAGEFDEVAVLLEALDGKEVRWHIGSVNRAAAGRLVDWLRSNRAAEQVVLLTCRDLPLEVRLDRPDMVGIDRLLAAVAANRLRAAGRAAVVVDLGTAITVDLLSAEGAFLGGAILPGTDIAARAMQAFTDALPLVDLNEVSAPPPALGRSTVEAMRAGLYWSALGGVRELIAQYAALLGEAPQVFLSGGAAVSIAQPLAAEAVVVPDLTLSGIAVTAQR